MNTPEDLKAVEAMLTGLRPTGARVDRDQLMFEAGWAAAEQAHQWHWRLASVLTKRPLATAAALLVAVTLGVLLLTRSGPMVADRAAPPPGTTPDRAAVAADSRPQASPPAIGAMPGSYFDVRNRLLELAAKGLPLEAATHERAILPSGTTAVEEAAEPADSRALMRQLLEEDRQPKRIRSVVPISNHG